MLSQSPTPKTASLLLIYGPIEFVGFAGLP
jgi:hypothetical protein